jgi:hypothetical protein
MAKRNKGPALFEVIRAAQQKELERQQKLDQQGMQGSSQGSAPSLLKSPANWFKSMRAKPASEATAMREEPTIRTVERKRSQPINHPPAASVPATPRPAVEAISSPIETPIVARPKSLEAKQPVVTPEAAPRVEAKPRDVVPPVASRPLEERPPRVFPERAETSASEAARRVREEIAAASRQQTPVSDRDAIPDNIQALFTDPLASPAPAAEPIWRRLPPQVNYYSAGIVAGIVLVTGMLVYLGTRDRTDRPEVVINPQVINIKPDGSANIAPTNTPARVGGSNTGSGAVGNVVPPNRPEATGIEKVTPIAPPKNVKRVIGQQYIVLVSVPPKAENVANEIVKYLADNGIPTTKEQALPGYSPTWFSVVTTRGFEQTKGNTDYQQYSQRLEQLMKNYAKGSKFVSTFKLDLYTWRARAAN